MNSLPNNPPSNGPDKDTLKEGYDLFKAGRYAEALPVLSKLERSGSPYAAIYLGNMYVDGLGVVKDTEQALAYFRSASDAGTPLGSFYVGALLEKLGRFQECVAYYRAAAQGGDISAAYALSRLGRRGAAQISSSETDIYFRQALDAGHVFAKRDLAILMLQGRYGILGYLKAIPLFVATLVSVLGIWWKDPTSEKLY